MIPIRDNIPSRTFPVVTVGLIVVNVLVFMIELLGLGRGGMREVTMQYGLVPAALTQYFSGGPVPAGRAVLPIFTAIFLHAGFVHLIGNMWYLWIFGDNVEDRLGHLRFLAFFILCGVVGNLAHYVFNSGSPVPAIGASGAVAGVLGVYLVSYPKARILVLIPIFFFLQFIELPALIVLGFWIVLQFVNGAASVVYTQATGGVAWWAHIGGFFAGILVFKLFRPRPKISLLALRRDRYDL
jgi:membrane associated rhomboid family serine protease